MFEKDRQTARFAYEIVLFLEHPGRSPDTIEHMANKINAAWGHNAKEFVLALRAGEPAPWARMLAWFSIPRFRFLPIGGIEESVDLMKRLVPLSPFARNPRALRHAIEMSLFEIMFGD